MKSEQWNCCVRYWFVWLTMFQAVWTEIKTTTINHKRNGNNISMQLGIPFTGRLKIAKWKFQANTQCFVCMHVCLCQLDVHYYRFSCCYSVDDAMIFIEANLCISISSKDWFIFYIKLSYAFVIAFCPLFPCTWAISFCLFIPQHILRLNDSCNKCLENSCWWYRKKNRKCLCMKQ